MGTEKKKEEKNNQRTKTVKRKREKQEKRRSEINARAGDSKGIQTSVAAAGSNIEISLTHQNHGPKSKTVGWR
jgi:hypothetical protein